MLKKIMTRKIIILFILISLSLVNILLWIIIYNLNQPQDFEVVFFDVGQGDSALIKTHLGHYILIDGGEYDIIIDKLAKEIPFYRKEIDLIILSHAHADHLGGLLYVLENYKVSNILWNGQGSDSGLFLRWQRELTQNNYNVKIAQSGQRIKSQEFFIDILYPFNNIEKESFNDLNLSSIILRAVYNEKSFLFTGDAYKQNEEELIRMEDFCKDKRDQIKCRGMILDSDVLKVGHHGSRTSTSKEFVEKVSPLIAVISSGIDNRYGHPHKEVLEVLENYDIRIERTDLNQDIRIIVN